MSNMEIAAQDPRPHREGPSGPIYDPAERRLERAIHRSMYLGVQRLRGRPVGKLMRRLASWDALDAPSYAKLSTQRLESILEYASAHVPLYRSEAWQSRIGSNPRDLFRWPLLERRRLVDRRDDLVSRAALRPLLYARHSSASSGTPIEVLWNRDAVAWSWAAEYHPMLWHDLEIGARTLRMWGSAWIVENLVLNRHFVPAHDLTPVQLDDAVRYIETRKPDLVWGTPSAVHELARHIDGTRGRSASCRVPYVKVGGEQLYSFQRDDIVRYLGERLIESYGCTEMGPIAAECPAGSMHLLTANVHVEIFRDDAPVAPGEHGEIVATNLVNRGMPLIRCRIGDLGAISPEPCSCGRPQPVLASLRGRAADLVLTADGTPIHGSVLGDALERCSGDTPLGSAQKVLFEQIDRSTWSVRVEAHRPPDREALERQVTELLRDILGPGCSAKIDVVPKIAREPSGKFRYYKALGGSPRRDGADSDERTALHSARPFENAARTRSAEKPPCPSE